MVDEKQNQIEISKPISGEDGALSHFQAEYTLAMADVAPAQLDPLPNVPAEKLPADPEKKTPERTIYSPLCPPEVPAAPLDPKNTAKATDGNFTIQINDYSDAKKTPPTYICTPRFSQAGTLRELNLRYFQYQGETSASGRDIYFKDAPDSVGKNCREVIIKPMLIEGGYKCAIMSYPEQDPDPKSTDFIVRSASCETEEDGSIRSSSGNPINGQKYESKYHLTISHYAGIAKNSQGQVVGTDLKEVVHINGDTGKALARVSYLDEADKVNKNKTGAIYFDPTSGAKTAEVKFAADGINEMERVEYQAGSEQPSRTLLYHANGTPKKEIIHDYFDGQLITEWDVNGIGLSRQTLNERGQKEVTETSTAAGQVNLSFFDTGSGASTAYAIVHCSQDSAGTITPQRISILDDKGRLQSRTVVKNGQLPWRYEDKSDPNKVTGIDSEYFDKNGAGITGQKLDNMLKSPRFQYLLNKIYNRKQKTR